MRDRFLVPELGDCAEFETAAPRERQMEGIARAKAEGVCKDSKPSIDGAKVKALADEGIGGTEIARRLEIGRTSVYRILASSRPLLTHSGPRGLECGVSVEDFGQTELIGTHRFVQPHR